MTSREELRKLAFELSCHDQYDLAFKIAENVGYVLTEAGASRQPSAPAQAPFNGAVELSTEEFDALEKTMLEPAEPSEAAIRGAALLDKLYGGTPPAQPPVNPVCDLQALLEIRDFLADIVGGAEITERSRDTATGFVSIMDSQFKAAWASQVSSTDRGSK